jgi:rhodanese-related sulfurtransferase
VAQKLMEHGWKNVHPLFEGFDAWKEAGLPLDKKEQE